MIFFYRLATFLLYPLLILLIYLRKFLGKEDKLRFKEKFLIKKNSFSSPAKNKKVIWFHAASIGEVNSIIPFINHILKEKNDIFVLLTSTSLSSSELIKKKIDLDYFGHQFFLLDISFLVKKFLDYWKPHLAIFVDSEVWPSHIIEIKKRKIPLILLNGRITNKTFKRWKMLPNTSRNIFELYDLCLASSSESQNNLKNLGAKNVKYFGNIKFCAEVKSEKDTQRKIPAIKDKKIWSAASTHPGEEIFFLNTHLELKKNENNILTIIIPRHINRSKEIFEIGKRLKLKIEILDNINEIKNETEVIIINSIGNMIDIFNYSKSVFMGKSLLNELKEVGGQNPIEPAKCGCKIYHGQFVANFKEIYNFLNDKKIAFEINNETKLSDCLLRDFVQEKIFDKQNIIELNTYGKKILSKSLDEILALK